jgi:hypothetical protein
MAGDLDSVGGYTEPTYLKNSAIHHSFARCFSIHGSHGVYVYNNVGYDIMGHCFFLEDGIETRNTLDHNLGALTQYGYLLLSDMSQAYCQVFWWSEYGEWRECGERRGEEEGEKWHIM